MMKWLTVAIVALAVAAPALAADDAAKSVRVRGVVKEVKADEGKTDAGTLVVTTKKDNGEEDVSFVVKPDAIIKSGDKELKLSDLKVKDKVRVDYQETDGKKVPSKIRLENEE